MSHGVLDRKRTLGETEDLNRLDFSQYHCTHAFPLVLAMCRPGTKMITTGETLWGERRQYRNSPYYRSEVENPTLFCSQKWSLLT